MRITYWGHSGFSAETEDMTLLFDYTGGGFARPEKTTIALVSHDHADHWMPAVADLCDILVRGMQPGETRHAGGAVIRAFGSTDEGVSYLVEAGGKRIFHAGDFNLWHWKDESTPDEIKQATDAFTAILDTLRDERMDAAFFPVDPRMGSDYDEGAEIFLREIKPAIIIPMHWWDRPDAATAFAEKHANAAALTVPGQFLDI